MLAGSQSGCINHPGIEASYRCKQCGIGVCGGCVQMTPSGHFCSQVCREKFEQFSARAKALDDKMKKPVEPGLFVKLKNLAVGGVLLLLVLGGLGVAGSLWQVPVLTDVVWKVRGIIGL